MKRLALFALAALCAAIMVLSVASCSKKQPQKATGPVYYEDKVIAKVNELTSQGYALLDKKDLKGALSKFEEAGKLIPNGMIQEYNTAAAYARAGKTEDAFTWMDRLAFNGMDEPERLLADTNFASIRGDIRFGKNVDRARNNYTTGTAALAKGLPEYTGPADTFATMDGLQNWMKDEEFKLYKVEEFWTQSQWLSAQATLLGRFLADEKRIKAGDKTFDAGLERVRAVFRLGSVYQPGWYTVSDLVLHESNAYEQTSPPPSAAALAEARYLGAAALSLKYPENDARRVATFSLVDTLIAKIPAGTDYYAAGRALKVVDDAKLPDADETVTGPELRNLLKEFPGNALVYRVVSTRLGADAVHLLWPIQLDVSDIDGKKVSLDQYRGKALLIDFWATWCSPCRHALPSIVAAYKKYNPQGFEVVSISLDYLEKMTAAAYRDSTKAFDMTWRHVYDGKAWDAEIVKRFFVAGIPAPFLVGRDGSLVAWGDDCLGPKLTGNIEKALAAK